MRTKLGVAKLRCITYLPDPMANFFKKKGHVATSGIQMTDSEAALAQSDFNIEKITEIQNRFTGGLVLVYPGRIFIREGLLWKVCRKGPKKRQFFLFNDVLVYGSVVANRYSNQHILPLSQMSVSAECFYQPRVNADFDEDSEQMELDAGNAFQISHANKSFHVFALSSADKANWLANLHKHINRVAQSVSSENQLVTKPVWVPDSMSKECMICSMKFTAFIRKHHCRRCGRVVCSTCSPHRMPSSAFIQSKQSLPVDAKKLERVCVDCFKEMSSVAIRPGGGRPVQQPPPATIAAQVVSNIIQTTNAAKSSSIEDDSSTDTEDSDDSEKEDEKIHFSKHPVQTSTPENVGPSEGVNSQTPDSQPTEPIPPPDSQPTHSQPTPPSESIDSHSQPTPPSESIDSQPTPPSESIDSQPTPPPRKKKLKKKLEQLIEQKVELTCVEDPLPPPTRLDMDNQNSNVAQKSNEEVCSDRIQEVAGGSLSLTEGKSPKKSRRRKKHMQSTEGEHSMEEEHTEDGTSQVSIELDEEREKKAKIRKTKFK